MLPKYSVGAAARLFVQIILFSEVLVRSVITFGH